MISRRITIVVPCYNEAARLDGGRFASFAEENPDVSFLFVDDGSTDSTWSMLDALAGENPDQLRSLRLERNQGKAEAVRRGIVEAAGDDSATDYVGFWDADLATPLSDIPAFAKLLDERSELEMVFGSRVNLLGRSVKRNLVRHWIGRIFATMATAVLRLPIYDTQCGAKMFRVTTELRDIFADSFVTGWIFDVEIIARYVKRRRGTDRPPVDSIIFEYPLMRWDDVQGSKLKPTDFLTASIDLLRIQTRYFMDGHG